jgi:hypothetical protein
MSNKEMTLVTEKDFQNVMKELEDSFFDIPFGNTGYQTKAFVMSAAITPERMYRTIGLQILSLMNSVNNTIYHLKIGEIERQEDLEKLNSPDLSNFEKQKLQLSLNNRDDNSKFNEKTLNDTIHELNILYAEFKKLPKFTREQFEAAEENYFTQSLERQARGISGAVEALINMKEDVPALSGYVEQISKIEKLDNETLQNLRLGMPNQLQNVLKKEMQQAAEAQLKLQ